MLNYPFWTGLVLVALGGIMEGSYSIPLKFTPGWEWENIWGAGSLMALILVPWPLAALTIPNLAQVYHASSTKAICAALLFGAGWGAGGVFFGLGVAALGLSLGLSLILGLVAIGGSVVPLLMQHPEQFIRPAGLTLVGGVAVMIAGLVLCAWAGKLKDISKKSGNAGTIPVKPKTSFKVGLMFCVASGLLSALVNFGLIFGGRIVDAARMQAVNPSTATNAVWALVFTSNYIVNVAYCGVLAWRRRSLGNFLRKRSASNWAQAVAMGVFWAGGIVVYGWGATQMGSLGDFIGYPIMLIV